MCARRLSVIEDSVLPPTDELRPWRRKCTPPRPSNTRKIKHGTRNPRPGGENQQGKKKKRLGKKLNLLEPVKLYRRPPEPREALGKERGKDPRSSCETGRAAGRRS